MRSAFGPFGIGLVRIESAPGGGSLTIGCVALSQIHEPAEIRINSRMMIMMATRIRPAMLRGQATVMR
jgi:hypothetical protein